MANASKAPRILIVDDDSGQRSLLDSFLRSQGFDTVPVASGEDALEVLRAGQINMMISDVREAVHAMRDGAVNYLANPIDLDELLATVQQATGISKPARLKFSAERQLPAHVIAHSPLMQAVFHDASLIAPSESRILITGE